jgi:hypothetical protein
VHEAETSIDLVEHRVVINVYAQIMDVHYDDLMKKYVTIPEPSKGGIHTGVVFYLPGNLPKGELPGNIVLDRITNEEESLVLKVNVGFDARSVPLARLLPF